MCNSQYESLKETLEGLYRMSIADLEGHKLAVEEPTRDCLEVRIGIVQNFSTDVSSGSFDRVLSSKYSSTRGLSALSCTVVIMGTDGTAQE